MNQHKTQEDLREIRRMMEESTKFLSLSGLSGVFAGITALVGAYFAHLEIKHFSNNYITYEILGKTSIASQELSKQLLLIAGTVLLVAIGTGFLFTWLKAKKENKQLVSKLSIRLIISLGVPLFFGGAFVLALFYHGFYGLVAPATLIFYGLALLNCSKYVHVDIKYLALCEMALGVAAAFFLYYGIYFWAVGFGVLHILYGAIMYFKYDRK
ncbi:membrane protein [Crocinitomix catalasitica]|uniref:membrane protein n=1 Tax=Crocinitomix catalasitica TaxID=184607 RepID=UPI000485EE7A|nr:membrane protein [Crocinitomix catalasitica]